ncbi:hypothetical protein Scep_010674 [Stephania cephalantha]|uniref:Uncharacterized protein n=1 Tax=Stephania cephalantha TaxID=152367 RepID=A0AAP0PDI6_9MAGN
MAYILGVQWIVPYWFWFFCEVAISIYGGSTSGLQETYWIFDGLGATTGLMGWWSSGMQICSFLCIYIYTSFRTCYARLTRSLHLRELVYQNLLI